MGWRTKQGSGIGDEEIAEYFYLMNILFELYLHGKVLASHSVFSLRSEESCGVGEFNDLKKMVDWVKKTVRRIIQTLPINDTILYHTQLRFVSL
jgi:hypothetical protein